MKNIKNFEQFNEELNIFDMLKKGLSPKNKEVKYKKVKDKPFHITEGPEKGNNKIVTSPRPKVTSAPQPKMNK